MQSVLIHRNDTRHSLGLTTMPKDLTPRRVRSNLSCRYSTTAKRFHIRLLLSLAVALMVSVLSQSATAQSTFANPTRIAILDDLFLEASPYPSNITVSGLSGSVSRVTVTLTNLNFGFPRDVDILLVGPNGQSVILMSDARDDGTGHIINKTFTFDDAALLPLPSDSTLTSGTYKPTNFDSELDVDFFSAPAPAGSYGTTLSVFNGTTPNGTWSLYMVDDNLGDDPFGELPQEITGGWSLAVMTQTTPPSDTSVWSITGNLNVARLFHTATLLPNGKVLINGGFGGGPSSSAELYDRATGIWTNAASSNLIHYYPTATLLPNGKVLVVSDDNVGIPTGGGAELFDPVTGTWSLTGRLNNTERTFHTATLLPNGKVLVAGGATYDFFFIATKSVELYDPATGTWTPTGNLTMPRANHTATLLPNGKVLVVGGVDWDEGGPIYDSAELYDPATGIWSVTGSLTTARSDHTATLLANGKVLVAGGLLLNRDYFVTNSAELYDPSTGNWSTTGSLNTTRHGQTATLLPDGKVLVAGGSSTSNVSNTSLNTAELYDPASGTWSPTKHP